MKYLYEIICMAELDEELGFPNGKAKEIERVYVEKTPEEICAKIYDWKLKRNIMRIGNNVQEIPIEGVAYISSSELISCLDKEPMIICEFRRIDIIGAFTYDGEESDCTTKLLDCKSAIVEKLKKIFDDSWKKVIEQRQRINEAIERYEKFLR